MGVSGTHPISLGLTFLLPPWLLCVPALAPSGYTCLQFVPSLSPLENTGASGKDI